MSGETVFCVRLENRQIHLAEASGPKEAYEVLTERLGYPYPVASVTEATVNEIEWVDVFGGVVPPLARKRLDDAYAASEVEAYRLAAARGEA